MALRPFSVTQPSLFKARFIFPALSIILAVLALVGWTSYIDCLKRGLASGVAMNQATAVCLILLASEAIRLNAGNFHAALYKAGQLAIIIVIAASAMKLGELVFGSSFAIDRQLFSAKLDAGLNHPSRMAPDAVAGFFMLGFMRFFAGDAKGDDGGTVSTASRFPLLRRLSITSLVAMLVTAAILIFLYRQDQFAEHEEIAEQENERTAIHLTQQWDEQIAALISTADKLDARALHTNPNIGLFTAEIESAHEHHVLKLEIYNLSGTVVYSSTKSEIGGASDSAVWLAKALRGETTHHMEFRDTFLAASGELHDRYIANTYMPLAHAGKRIGAIEIYADATPIIQRIFSKTISIALVVFGAFAALYAALFFSVFRTDRAVARWQKALADNTQKLAASEQRFHDVSDAAGEYLWEVDTDMVYTYVSNRSVEVKGYSPEELLGHTPMEFMPEEDIAPVGEIVSRAIANKAPFNLQHRDITKSGAVLWEEVNGVPFYDAGGTVIGLRGAGMNITGRKQTELRDKALVLRNQVLMRSTNEGIHILDDKGKVIEANDAFCRHLGYTQDEILRLSVFDFDAKLTADELRANIKKLQHGHAVFETVHRRKDGSLADVEVNVSGVELDGQECFYALSRDITERKRTELALHESQERLHATIETSMDAIVQINAEGTITGWNSQMEEVFGWSRVEAVGRAIHEMIIPLQHREAHMQGLKHFLLTGEGPILGRRIEIIGLHRDGHVFPIELTVTPIKMGGKYEFSAFIRDITKKKESEEIIWKQANFDDLTGLPNRHMFHDRLEQALKKAQRTRIPLALMLIDLDNFKEVNDTLGHDMGDVLLVEAARRITDCVRLTDTVARLGGDEFVVILSELDDISSAERITQCIIQKISDPYHLKGEISYVSASIGVTLYPNDADTIEGLFKNADQAMYVAKEQGRNRHSYFTPAIQEAAQTRLRLINDLRGALSGNQFMVYFQPIVELATGRINKAEALIRWKHPERGMVSPVDFIPLAEETGLIFEIGDWVFHESMRWAKRWRTLHTPLLQISVNKSPIQFYKDGEEHSAWLAHLRKLDLPGQSLSIEITEGLLMESNASVTGALLTLRDVGIQISMDDFGTGYSSLSYLKKFDIDYLKIDQSFVRDLKTDPNDLALSEAIIVMGHKLGMKVIAEGVETKEQRDLLVAAGCDYAQGYWYSRPVPPEEFEGLLERSYL